MTIYEDLPLLPNIIAEKVCSEPYLGTEMSEGVRDAAFISRTEAARRKMTPDQVREFADLCDAKCKAAYNSKAKWFVTLAKAKDNRGRDQLAVWITHWLASYLTNPLVFRRSCETLQGV